MNLNTFIDYTCSKPVRVHGFEAHLQASAIYDGCTILLALQGRATHIRALWAAFHEKRLITTDVYYPRADGKVYVSPTPTIALPQGIQMWIIHHDLTPTHCSHTADHFLTFGPPHFAAMLAATTAVSMLPHWEQTVWQIGLRQGLIEPIRHCYNTTIYAVSRNTQDWLTTFQTHHNELSIVDPSCGSGMVHVAS
ncbi:MAG: hypothetical protein GY832_40130 [Chloroflexi bacterium]|nr:hypothetical protein [Chloroflexota bacterium]